MKLFTPALLLLFLWSASHSPTASAGSGSNAGIWVDAYYPVWVQRTNLPPDKIDFSAFSQIIQFSIMPTASGDIDQSDYNAVTPAISEPVVKRAHAAGDKVIICLGGENSGPRISTAIAPTLRQEFVSSLTQFVKTRGYDGIDIDMEPIADKDIPNYVSFIHDLRRSLDSVDKNLVLTAAAPTAPGPVPAMFARLQRQFDQINVMTYDLSGPWPGFKSWYNSSLYGNGSQFLFDTIPYPSIINVLQRYTDAGIPAPKLGIGIAFYGYAWKGIAAPAQPIQGATMNYIDYGSIMDQYYSKAVYHWDNTAHAPYLGIPNNDPSKSLFISYDDERLCREKVLYAKSHQLGGVIIFDLGAGFRPNQPSGQQDTLLKAVKKAWKETGPPVAKNRH
jgi:chitinase